MCETRITQNDKGKQLNRRLYLVILIAVLFGVVEIGVLSAETLVIGGDASYPPYEYLDEQNQPKGYNVDLSRELGKELGMNVEINLKKWSRIREELDSGELDLVQGMAFSVERAKSLSFSEPHFKTWRSLFVRKNSKVQSLKDLKHGSIIIQQGDIAADFFAGGWFEGKVIEVPSQESALELLSSGNGDGALINYMHGSFLIKTHKLKNVKAIDQEILPKYYCYASKDPALIKLVNQALIRIQEDGRLGELQRKWFRSYNPDFIRERLNNRKIIIVHSLFFAILIFFIVRLLLKLRSSRNRSRELALVLKKRSEQYNELKDEFAIIENGPLIAYSYQIDPPQATYISKGIESWGYTQEEAIIDQQGNYDIVFSEDRSWVRQRFEEQLQDGIVSDVKQYRVLTKSGEIRWVMDYDIMIRDSDGKGSIHGFLMDITSQKNLEAELLEAKEKAESANVAKGHFLASMSHEIRTPLNGILGFIQVLMQMECSSEQREYYDIIYSSGQSLLKIINDVLDVSKIESGKMDLILNDFNPVFLIEDVVKGFAYQREKPGVDIRTRINENIPGILHGDMMRLRQIFINLMQNAMKFTDDGYIEIGAEVYNRNDHDLRVLFSVTDTGIGIDPMKQKDIFDNFSQLDNRITRKYGGTGLGLSIVKRLVELMGGFIWVESEPGKGSSFFFILPFKHHTDVQAAPYEAPGDQQFVKSLLPNLKVLLVEDDPVNQSVAQKQLENWNLSVTVACNGSEAVDIYRDQDFDCILMDIQMPIMDGVTATINIRKIGMEQNRHTIIYAFTAAVMAGDRERFIAAGMDDYISKPVDLEYLYSLLLKVPKQDIGSDIISDKNTDRTYEE